MRAKAGFSSYNVVVSGEQANFSLKSTLENPQTS
jgi:hypothetical protein